MNGILKQNNILKALEGKTNDILNQNKQNFQIRVIYLA